MAALPSGNYNPNEAEVTLGLLNAVHGDKTLTQRSAAKELDVALGLVNTYLKRCVKAGLIKVKQAPSSRYAYYLTPKGFAEKSRLTATYLSKSMSFFRLVRVESADLLRYCEGQGWWRIALVGKSELCEITILAASDYAVELVAIIDAEAAQTTGTFMGIPVHAGADEVESVDAFMITDMKAPQDTYEGLVETFAPERVLAMPFIGIHRENDTASLKKGSAL
jgi:DNA-binding MarR family transcriptional regulator